MRKSYIANFVTLLCAALLSTNAQAQTQQGFSCMSADRRTLIQLRSKSRPHEISIPEITRAALSQHRMARANKRPLRIAAFSGYRLTPPQVINDALTAGDLSSRNYELVFRGESNTSLRVGPGRKKFAYLVSTGPSQYTAKRIYLTSRLPLSDAGLVSAVQRRGIPVTCSGRYSN